VNESESRSPGVEFSLSGPGSVAEAVGAARAFGGDARLCIVIEELVANIFEHGALPADAAVTMRLRREGQNVVLILEDPGTLFDLTGSAGAANIPERGGGAGIRIVKAWAQSLSYRSEGGINRLVVSIPAGRP